MTVFSGLIACLCWFHLVAAVKKHALNKLKIDQEYLKDTILPIIRALHRAGTDFVFDTLLSSARKQFTEDGKFEFLEYFEENYANRRWRNWYIGALPITGGGFTNNPEEACNRQMKIVVVYLHILNMFIL